MTNAINWFEIPVTNFKRAKKFYEHMLDAEINEMPMPDAKYGVLPYEHQKNGVGGAIIEAEGIQPSANGVTVYINGGDNLSTPLAKVEAAGGKVLMPKTSIGENGFMAQFIDTEGNRIALHSMS